MSAISVRSSCESVYVNLCVCVSVLYVDLCGHVTLVHELIMSEGSGIACMCLC